MPISAFLFTDIEGSTRLWGTHGALMRAALERHDRMLARVVRSVDGELFKHTGDGIAARFDDPIAALVAAVEAQLALRSTDWGPLGELRIRAAIHVGDAQRRGGDWFGPTLNRTARLMSIGHGGQVLLSAAAAELVRDRLISGATLIDLGLHRLRDLAEPEHVWQAWAPGLASGFPPLRSLDATMTNLPSELSTFLGRDLDIIEVAAQLSQHRLVTLTGPGGVGKTRLALHVAAELLSSFPQGAWLCELANITRADALDHAVLASLGFVVRPDATARASLVDALSNRELLVVLDNCEHIRDAVADLVDVVLHAAPRIKVLATGREALGIPGEVHWAVNPLLIESDAVELFALRAAEVRRGFTVTTESRACVADICRQLDGVPLAIELAAARVRSLGLEDIRERLGERFRLLSRGRSSHAIARHASLQAALDWSYDLLARDEQVLFDRLSVFVGGFDSAAATAVAPGGDSDELDVLDLVTALVDKSTVQLIEIGGGSRYRLLETMRAFGARHLQDDGTEDEVRRRHAEHFASFVEWAASGLRGPDEADWVRAYEADFDNVRLAVRWSIDHGEIDLAFRLIGAPWTYFLDRLLAEPGEWATDALRLPGAEHHPLAALTHIAAGWGASGAARYDDLLSHGQSAIALSEANAPGILWMALNVGWAGALPLGRTDLLRQYTERIVPAARVTGDPYAVSRSLWCPLLVHRTVWLDIDAKAAASESLILAEQVGNPTLLARAHILSGIVKCEGDPTAARGHFALAEGLARTVNARMLIGYGMTWAAIAASIIGPELAATELRRSLEWHESSATPDGALRVMMRDLLPAIERAGLHRLVLVLDAHLPPVAIVQPDAASQAVDDARHALGSEQVEAIRAEALAMTFADVLSLLHQELAAVAADTVSPS